jgi:CelD/BcsL family acetyltransferase involved in cellulose biosynthesis
MKWIPRFRPTREPDRFDVVTDVEAFKALEGEWDHLCERAKQVRFSQSFAWCWTTWEAVERPRGRRLHCIVGRNRDLVVLIWPVIVEQSFPSVASPLGCAYSEYPDPLVEGGSEAIERIEAAWQTLRNTCGCDMIRFRYVRHGSPLHHVLISKVGKQAKEVFRVPNLSVSWDNYETWEKYYRALQRKNRAETERCQRRLEDHGKVLFKVVEGADCAPIIEWALANKVEQLNRTHRRGGHWLRTKAYRDLLVWTASRTSPHGRLVAFVLKFHDQVIATLICRVDKFRVEGLNTVYDAAYRRYGPGKILIGFVLKWAFKQGLTFDWRGGDEDYKKEWANSESTVITYEVAISALYKFCRRYPAVRPLVRNCRLAIQKVERQFAYKWQS